MNSARARGLGAAATRRYAIAILLGVCAISYLPPAVATPFFTKGEPREGLVVRRMVENGEWMLPRRPSGEGVAIASKPPLFHWLGALTSHAAGATTELTVRLPSVVLATAAVLVVYLVGSSMLGYGAGFAAALVLATNFEWLRAATTARVDAALTAFMTFGLLILYRGFVRDRLEAREAAAAYFCLACAALVKGPVGVVLPGLIVLVAAACYRNLGVLRRMQPFLGAAIVIVCVGAWYLAAAYVGGDAFVRKQILKENVFRYVAASTMKSGHEHPFYYYLPALAAGLLPWTPVVIAALVAAARHRDARRDPRVGFLLVWAAVVFVFYSLASAKRSVYLLALYPAAALLTGWWWERLSAAPVAPAWLRGRAAQAVAVAAGVVVIAPLLVVLLEAIGIEPFTLVGPLLHPKDRANLPLVQGIIDAQLIVILFVLAFMLGTVVALHRAIAGGRPAGILVATALFAITLWSLVFSVFQPPLARARTLKPFLAEVERRSAGAPVRFHTGTFDFGAAFYAPDPGEADAENAAAASASSVAPEAADDADDADDDDESDRRAPATSTPLAPGAYVLIWDDALAALSPAERADIDVLATSSGTDPKGAKHLVLARRRPPAG